MAGHSGGSVLGGVRRVYPRSASAVGAAAPPSNWGGICPPSVQGAMVRSAGIADSRRIAHGSRRQVEAALHAEHRRLRDTLWELLVKNAPSARR